MSERSLEEMSRTYRLGAFDELARLSNFKEDIGDASAREQIGRYVTSRLIELKKTRLDEPEGDDE